MAYHIPMIRLRSPHVFKRRIKFLSILLLINFFYSQTVYAFGSTMLTTSIPSFTLPISGFENRETFKDSRGLESLGVSPQIAGFAGSLVAGGILGGIRGNTQSFINGHVVLTSIQQNIQSSIQTVITLNQVGNLGLEMHLDPQFANIIGLSLSAIQGIQIQNPGTTLEKAFSTIKPDLLSSLAQYGVERLGTTIGLDPRVSSLIGTPISGAINAGFGTAWADGNAIISGIENGIARGVTSLVLEKSVQDLDPLVGALVERTVTGAFAGLVGPNHNVIDGILNGYQDSALNIVRLGNFGDDPWSQAQYLSRVIGFSDSIKQKGLAQAVEDYAAGVLHEDSVSSILRSFQSVGAYVQDQINNNKIQTVQIAGVNYKQINLPNGNYLMFNGQGTDLVEVKTGGHILRGVFGQGPDGQAGLVYGTDTWSNSAFQEITLGYDGTPGLTLTAENGSDRYTMTYGSSQDMQTNRPSLIMDEAINREGPKVTILKGIQGNPIQFDSTGHLVDGSLQQDENYSVVQNGEVIASNALIDEGVLAARPWIQRAWNNWSNLVTTDPTLQSIGGYGVAITESILTAPQAFTQFIQHPISSILAIPAALQQAYGTINGSNPYQSGLATGNIFGGIEVGLVTDAAIGTIPNPSGALSDLESAQRLRVLNNIAESQAARQASQFELYTSAIRTPQGLAVQSQSVAALDAISQVQNGATLYRIGTIGRSNVADAQYWSLENPLSPGFAERYGIPPENVATPDLVITAKLKPGYSSFITRPAPGVSTNGGGMIEVVTEEGAVDLQSVSVGGS